ncbi:MAG: hypothetical protein H7Z41_01640 [Cytophagales bacterium]|nr:hypothetical protein [Armatimonadota bacterium]
MTSATQNLDTAPLAEPDSPAKNPVRKMQGKVREWIRALHRDPDAEERAMGERRALLLEELNRAVADAPDDVPIRDIIARLNSHLDD